MLLNTAPTLRQATQADWPAIEALLVANKLPIEGARTHLNTYLLAISNGEVVGSAGAEVYGQIALLRSVAVAPGLQKQGIGKLLLNSLLQEARRRDIGRLYLLTVSAPEYFAQFGFKRGKIEDAPHALKASAEFQGACPACAAFMALDDAPGAESSCCGDATVTATVAVAAPPSEGGRGTTSCSPKAVMPVVAAPATSRRCG